MLARASWLPLAEELAHGTSRRRDHDCGDGRTLLIRRGDDGYRAWCFRCNDGGSAPPPPEPLEARLQRLAKVREGERVLGGASDPLVLPMPAVHDVREWPTPHRLWLLKAGLGGVEIAHLGAYYHPPSDRVVVPVLEAGVPVFWQARAVDGRLPKWMAPAADKASILPRYGAAETVTLTEDSISAFKVGLAGHEGWSMMGTRLSDRALHALLTRGPRVNVWLDPDGPGQRAARKVLATLRGYGLTARNIESPTDPKLLHREVIQEKLR